MDIRCEREITLLLGADTMSIRLLAVLISGLVITTYLEALRYDEKRLENMLPITVKQEKETRYKILGKAGLKEDDS